MAEKFTQNEWDRLAEYIKDEHRRRAESKRREDLEKIWKHIDRQVLMKPKMQTVQTGDKDDWMPNTEASKQFNALEVLLADARRMMFPRGREWYTVKSDITDEFTEKFRERREKFPLIGSTPLPVKLDQETADSLVKATIDHYHRLYDHRAMWGLMNGEAFKYGTYVGRIRQATVPLFSQDSRGYFGKSVPSPVVIPCPIKNTFLDDSPMAILHEGIVTAPAIIRTTWKNLDDLKAAAKKGGSEKGWRTQTVARLEAVKDRTENDNHVELIEYEGDVFVPSSGESRYLPNVRVAVAVGGAGAKVVRFESDIEASYIIGRYLWDDVQSPYGSSPLMKGYPLQEAITEGLNRLMAAAALNAQPHMLYDKYDNGLVGAQGIPVRPGGQTGVEDVQTSVRDLQIGDPAALLNVYLALNKEYDDVTGVNDPRRGAQTKSHTTAFAVDTEQARGQIRTEDYVVDQQQGPMTASLYQEYAIIRKIMKTPQPVLVNSGGIEGWVNVSAQDLPERIGIDVHGALGPFDEREKAQLFLAATQTGMQLIATARQLQMPHPELDLTEVIRRVYQQAGENDVTRYLRPSQGTPPAPPPGAGRPAQNAQMPRAGGPVA